MIPPALLLLRGPFAAKELGLSWDFPGVVRAGTGKVDLFGRDVRGEVHWFKGGRFTAEVLAKDDALRTKEADASKGFTHVLTPTVFAGMPAVQSEERYQWGGVWVASRCVFCVAGDRGWVVRLWWPRGSATGPATAGAFLKSVKRMK